MRIRTRVSDMKASVVIILLSQLHLNDASIGDSSPPYIECTSQCQSVHSCPSSFSSYGWTVGDCFWCRYNCIWNAVEVFQRNGYKIPQFHGKWPFYSTFWAQEPASTIFSILNLLSVIEMRRRMVAIVRLEEMNGESQASGRLEMVRVWKMYANVGIVTWICSSWFHSSDHYWSERADYFSAFAFVLFALYAAMLFRFPILRRGRLSYGVALFFGGFYMRHVVNLLHHFDYGYNMMVCISSSIVTLIVYLSYLINRYRQFGTVSSLRRSDRLLLMLLTWTIASVALELLDFVPLWFTIDAHSLFHAATVPLPLITATFIETHARESGADYAKIV